jgi:hypothetical protein
MSNSVSLPSKSLFLVITPPPGSVSTTFAVEVADEASLIQRPAL